MIASAVIDLQNRKFEVFSFTKSTPVTSRGVASLYTDNLLKFQDLKLEGYGKERLYDFLAERFFSFYFEKYTKIKSWPYILIENKYLS